MSNFKEVEQQKKYSEMEHEVMDFWRKDGTFEKSVDVRSADDSYVFYDGPPFITGVPHWGTLLSSIIKDVVPRYWTMKGKRVERVWGWDCHGLPAENLVEKKLGIKDKRDVAKVGLEKYIRTCHSAMVQGGDEWEDIVARIGRWVDFKGAYRTMDKEYMESVWWAFKELHEKGKIYEGEKVLLYCSRCATPISKSEVAMDNSYKDVTDPSVYVKFELETTPQSPPSKEGEGKEYMLAWTTTPWTLSGNVALAVNNDIEYVKIDISSEVIDYRENKLSNMEGVQQHSVVDNGIYILSKEMFLKTPELYISALNFENQYRNNYTKDGQNIEWNKCKNIKLVKGKDLVGKKYKPLFDNHGQNAHKIVSADFVTTEEGTGIVHIAPAFGEDDYALSQMEKLPVINTVDENGLYIGGRWKGKNVWDVNKEIAKTLFAEGTVMKIDYVQHEYPHCHRCDTKLMYRAHPSWFMDIDGQRKKMIAKNKNINWFPVHIKEKRFRYIMETAPDWNLSRDRFWATPLPVWRGKKEDGTIIEKVVGSYAELKELSGKKLEDYHVPYVDEVTFEIDGVKMTRIDKVMDCWFESGSMPFAQFHYPFENKEKFEANFPGDFIVEYVGQVRAWFYYLHAVSIGLFGEEAFKNVIVTGTIAGNDGRKMSKLYGNYTAPEELLEKYSSDALRYLLTSSPLLGGEDFALVDKDVADVQRKLGTLWNSYSFFVMYAKVDGWAPLRQGHAGQAPDVVNVLDRWIISRLHVLIAEVDEHMQKYDLPNATKPVMKFIDDLSNWYIRRSRKRFWKSENDDDKNNAYATLHYILVELSKVIAPFTPFIAEEIYKNLTKDDSVHLVDFPQSDDKYIDVELNEQMQLLRDVIRDGKKLRAQSHIKVRQPLLNLYVDVAKNNYKSFTYHNDKAWIEFENILKDELNVKNTTLLTATEDVKEKVDEKNIVWSDDKTIGLNTELTDELRREGIAREIIRHIQQMRKKADYNIDDRITVWSSGFEDVFSEYHDVIAQEVLADEMSKKTKDVIEYDYEEKFVINEQKIHIYIKK